MIDNIIINSFKIPHTLAVILQLHTLNIKGLSRHIYDGRKGSLHLFSDFEIGHFESSRYLGKDNKKLLDNGAAI